MATATTERDPRHHTPKMQKRLQEIKDHLWEDIEKVDQLKAMFVSGSPGRLDQDYEQKNDNAWCR
jgi:hypothetical protein